MAHRYIVSAQTHDHDVSTAHAQVHNYLSHVYNNDPIVHQDQIIFLYSSQYFDNTHFITSVL